ncbi:MAG: urate hydroxylase PuuD [Dehalococcoidia bacterium]|jgi:putative copper export protein|nr:urate hydroxylase PuuD [Dehalococcoidia bacterium]
MFGEIAANDWFMLLVRWVHAIGAVAWIGGSAFFAFVLRSAERANPDAVRPALRSIGPVYRELVDIAVIAIIVSGLVLMFDRLTGDDASAAWFIVLGVKLALALWMFYLVWRFRQSDFNLADAPTGLSARLSWLIGHNAMVFIGVIVFLLASLMRVLFETTIAG